LIVADFIGYWEAICPVKTATPKALASLYKTPAGNLVIAVTNRQPQATEVTVTVDLKALGLEGKAVTAIDDTIAGLALWGGPCLPNAHAMMDCRLKLPCLVRALKLTKFGDPPRGYASPGVEYPTDVERVAKWGNWHCGENKARFQQATVVEESSVVERFLCGQAVRVVIIGGRHWQIKLEGDDWLKSIHHPTAALMQVDSDLLDDTRSVAQGLGLEVAANDYIITDDGIPHLLEVNHIPNVTRFPEIWEGYAEVHFGSRIGADLTGRERPRSTGIPALGTLAAMPSGLFVRVQPPFHIL
jgi:hypothetical protein